VRLFLPRTANTLLPWRARSDGAGFNIVDPACTFACRYVIAATSSIEARLPAFVMRAGADDSVHTRHLAARGLGASRGHHLINTCAKPQRRVGRTNNRVGAKTR